MANVPFIHGGKAKLQLKCSTSTTMQMAVVGGAGYSVSNNDRILKLAQGTAANAYPSNRIPGIQTPALDVECLLYAKGTGVGWFNAADLAYMLLTRDANGDLGLVDIGYTNGKDVITDKGKLASLVLRGDGRSNAISARLTFLCLGTPSAATFGTYSNSDGVPYYWKGTGLSWTPEGGSLANPYGIEAWSLSVYTGASYAKWADGTDLPSHIDVGDLACAAMLTQRAGADPRMDATRNGTLFLAMRDAAGANGVNITAGLNMLGQPSPLNVSGGLAYAYGFQGYKVSSTYLAIAADES